MPLRTLNFGIFQRHLSPFVSSIVASLIASIILVTATGPAQAKPAKADAAKAYAKSYINKKYGWGSKQYDCLVKVWEYESHWNYKSSGAGGKYLGIPQLNRGFIKHSGYSIQQYKASYKVQVRVGLKYIKSRYGTACGARAHIKRTGWY